MNPWRRWNGEVITVVMRIEAELWRPVIASAVLTQEHNRPGSDWPDVRTLATYREPQPTVFPTVSGVHFWRTVVLPFPTRRYPS